MNYNRKRKPKHDSNDTYDSNTRKRKPRTRSKAPEREIYDDNDETDSTIQVIPVFINKFNNPKGGPNNNDVSSELSNIDDMFEDDDVIEILIKKVKKSKLEDKIKKMCLNKLKNCDKDNHKLIEWIESILRIPFKQYAKLPISIKNNEVDIHNYFDNAQSTLDSIVHGIDNVKEELINFIAQCISTDNKSTPRIIGLHGPAGVGKTQIVKNGLSKILKRPMRLISMGGIQDSSHFLGFDFTYCGSRYGVIAQSLVESKIMNPIIFMDELDKISTTKDGLDIQNLLIHLTDPVQNMSFQDKYFSGIDIDLSKVIFIFSFNDINNISPILKDRIHIIEVPSPDFKSKVIIAKNYLLKDILSNIGFKEKEIDINDEAIEHLIREHCSNDKGVRNLKRFLETIVLKINTARFIGKRNKYKTLKNISFPFTITKDIIDEVIVKIKDERDDIIRSMFC